MQLKIHAAHADDPLFDGELPRVGCGICELRGEPITVQALPADNEVVTEAELLELMAAWSREHAATHSAEEHQEHEKKRIRGTDHRG